MVRARPARRPVTGALRPCRAPVFAPIIETGGMGDMPWAPVPPCLAECVSDKARRAQGILPVSLDNAAMALKLIG